MPRARRTRDDDTFDPIAEELDDMRKRLGDPFEGMTPAERKVAERRRERHLAKWQRRLDKAVAAWHAMTVLERNAWADDYLRQDRKRRGSESKPPKAADLPLLYAIVTVSARDRAKAARAREAEKAAAAEREAQRPENPAPPRATRPAPAPEGPAPDAEAPKPEKPRRRRQGPAFGPVGQQIDGVFYPYITDGDDE